MHTHSHWEAKPLGMFPGKTYRGYPDWILQETSDYSRGYTSELLVKRELECFYTSVPNSHWLRATLRKPLIPRKALHEHRQRGSNHLRQPSRKKKKKKKWLLDENGKAPLWSACRKMEMDLRECEPSPEAAATLPQRRFALTCAWALFLQIFTSYWKTI